jgi:hypothetical protein
VLYSWFAETSPAAIMPDWIENKKQGDTKDE